MLLVIAFILFRNNRQRKKANVVLQEQNAKIENTLSELKSTQGQQRQKQSKPTHPKYPLSFLGYKTKAKWVITNSQEVCVAHTMKGKATSKK